MDAHHIEDLESVDPSHFWFRAKQEYLSQLIRREPARIIDVGAGTGANLLEQVRRGHRVWAVDVNERALESCRMKGYETVKLDLQEQPLPEALHSPDYITALDVLEHAHKPVDLLRNLRLSSGEATRLIVTVPAYQALFSAWDVAMHHVKRYTRAMLCRELTESGWAVVRSSYIHVLPLLPAVFVRKVVEPVRDLLRPNPPPETLKFFTPRPLVNAAAFCLYYPEFACFRAGLPVPFGLSVLAVATPAGTPQRADTLAQTGPRNGRRSVGDPSDISTQMRGVRDDSGSECG